MRRRRTVENKSVFPGPFAFPMLKGESWHYLRVFVAPRRSYGGGEKEGMRRSGGWLWWPPSLRPPVSKGQVRPAPAD